MATYVSLVNWTEQGDESASAFALKLGAQGNVRTVTMRACSATEMERIIAKTK